MVKAVSEGKATITAKAGGKEATVAVTVKAAPVVPEVSGAMVAFGDGVVSEGTATFGGEIKWYDADANVGRTAGNRVGVKISAPADFDTSDIVQIKIGDKDDYTWENIKDGDGSYFEWWPLVTAAGQEFTATIKWNAVSEQTFKIVVVDATLQSEADAAVALAEASKKYSDVIAAENLVNALDESNDEKATLQERIQALWLELADTAKENLDLDNPTWDTLITAIHFLDKAIASGADATSLRDYYASIESLNMSGKNESAYDISTGALIHFTGLKRLNLSGTGISEVGGLAGLTELEELNVSNNELTELNVLIAPNPKTKLKVLDASNNKLENVVALAQLAGHEGFDPVEANWNICDNPFTHKDIEGHINLIKAIFADKGTLTENYTTAP